jgi:alpha-tubulin suppressor-like RCC1 family protein
MAAGDAHACALSYGGATCWGANAAGQSGASITDATGRRDVWLSSAMRSVVAVAAGPDFTCFAGVDGTQCIGQSARGQLGNGGLPKLYENDPLPRPVRALGDAIALAAGKAHVCAVRKSKVAGHGGQVLCWGANDDGQLGDGTSADASIPVAVLAPAPAVQVTK